MWRKLKNFGALQLKTSAYLLPDQPLHSERFDWLAKQVRDDGGEATLIRVSEIQGLANEEIPRMFNDALAQDYRALMKALAHLIERNRKRRQESFRADLDRFLGRFNGIREIDYFDCPTAQDAQMLLTRAEGLLQPGATSAPSWTARDFSAKSG